MFAFCLVSPTVGVKMVSVQRYVSVGFVLVHEEIACCEHFLVGCRSRAQFNATGRYALALRLIRPMDNRLFLPAFVRATPLFARAGIRTVLDSKLPSRSAKRLFHRNFLLSAA